MNSTNKTPKKTAKSKKNPGEQVRKSVESYFKDLNGEQPCDVYALVISEVEKPLLEVVMDHIDHK